MYDAHFLSKNCGCLSYQTNPTKFIVYDNPITMLDLCISKMLNGINRQKQKQIFIFTYI